MKKLFLIFSLIIVTTGCEDVIDVDVPSENPRLVIDASINWFKGTTGAEQEIKLSLTAPYFEDSVSPATGAQIQIENSSNQVFIFNEDSNTGIYKNNGFIPVINETYILTINYQGEIFTGSETFKSVSSINFVEQNDNGGFSGNETELKAYYTDPADEENYYFFIRFSMIIILPC